MSLSDHTTRRERLVSECARDFHLPEPLARRLWESAGRDFANFLDLCDRTRRALDGAEEVSSAR